MQMTELTRYVSDLVDTYVVPLCNSQNDCLPAEYFPKLPFDELVDTLRTYFGDTKISFLYRMHFGAFSIGSGTPVGHIHIPTRLSSSSFTFADYEHSHGLSLVFCSDNKWRLTSDIYDYDEYWNAAFPVFHQGFDSLRDLLVCMKLQAKSLDAFQ